MLGLRRLDAAGRRAYLDDVRPRLLVLRVRARGRHIVWAAPLWPFEQLLAVALGLALLAPGALRYLPGRLRSSLGSALAGNAGADAAAVLGREAPGTLLARLELLAGGGLGDALRLPPGEPYLRIHTDEADIDLTAY